MRKATPTPRPSRSEFGRYTTLSRSGRWPESPERILPPNFRADPVANSATENFRASAVRIPPKNFPHVVGEIRCAGDIDVIDTPMITISYRRDDPMTSIFLADMVDEIDRYRMRIDAIRYRLCPSAEIDIDMHDDGRGYRHVVAHTGSLTLEQSRTAAEIVLRELAEGQECFVRVAPEARTETETDFSTEVTWHLGYVRFSYRPGVAGRMHMPALAGEEVRYLPSRTHDADLAGSIVDPKDGGEWVDVCNLRFTYDPGAHRKLTTPPDDPSLANWRSLNEAARPVVEKLAAKVFNEPGSYVVRPEHVAALGGGDAAAGQKLLNSMLGCKPLALPYDGPSEALTEALRQITEMTKGFAQKVKL